MRRVGPMDLHHAARALAAAPPFARACMAERISMQAHAAHKFVKRLRRLHPEWGDGSLRSATLGMRKIETHTLNSDLTDGYLHIVRILASRQAMNDPTGRCKAICVCLPRC